MTPGGFFWDIIAITGARPATVTGAMPGNGVQRPDFEKVDSQTPPNRRLKSCLEKNWVENSTLDPVFSHFCANQSAYRRS